MGAISAIKWGHRLNSLEHDHSKDLKETLGNHMKGGLHTQGRTKMPYNQKADAQQESHTSEITCCL